MSRIVLLTVSILTIMALNDGVSFGYYNCLSPDIVVAIENKELSKADIYDVSSCIIENKNVEMLPYIVEELNKKLYDPSPYIRVLGELGGEKEKTFLLEFWKKLNNVLKSSPKDAVNYHFLFDSQITLIAALYKLGDNSHLEELYPLACHEDKGTRYYTARALGKIGGERAVAILRDMALNDPMRLPRYGAVSALMEMGDFEIFDKPDEFVSGGYITQDEADQIRRAREGQPVNQRTEPETAPAEN